jgi:hypothetical protein
VANLLIRCPSARAPVAWQVNIANPSTGCQKLIDIEDERKLYVASLRRPIERGHVVT